MKENEVFLLDESWKSVFSNDRIVVYGTGRIGRRIIPSLKEEFCIPYFIDNKDAGRIINDIPVKGVELVKNDNYKIIVTTMRGAYNDISSILSERGLRENYDYCLFERFAMEWNLRWKNRCVLAKIDTVVTSRCTLKCRNCNIFVSHIREQRDISFDRLKQNFDIFFDSVDFVYEYTLLGGEPFYHKEIDTILEYLIDSYGNRIGRINLISNGTVVPGKHTCQIMRENSISVHISDYTNSVHYKEKLNEVCECLKENEIEYYVIPNNTWKDIVYPKLSYTADNPQKHMMSCGHSTHSVGDGRLYWCDPAYAAERFIGYQSALDDYIDLRKNKQFNTKYTASLNIMKYCLGDINGKGYMSICEKCAGIGADNDCIVKAGEQVK